MKCITGLPKQQTTALALRSEKEKHLQPDEWGVSIELGGPGCFYYCFARLALLQCRLSVSLISLEKLWCRHFV